MRVLIVHNQLWAHYKSKLFSELHQLAPQFGASVHVAQIALSEKSRANMGHAEAFRYDYDYEVLFNDSLENVSIWPRTRALFKKMRQYRPDVLNITGYYDPAQLALLFYAKLTGVKVIVSNESNVRDQSRNALKEGFKKMVLGLADGFFCFGQSSAAYLQTLGIAPEKILTQKAAVVDADTLRNRYETVIPNRQNRKQALALSLFNFIFVGRFIAPKNLFMLLKAFAVVSQKSPDWGLILLGEGEQKTELEAFCQQNNLSNVHFLAGIAWHEVPDYLALADVFVLPSISEPWGLVVNEAMICHLPVLVSKACGCVEDLVRSGENGFTFDPNNEAELVEKLQYFTQNTAQFAEMGAVSAQMVAAFEPQRVAHEMWEGITRLK